MFGADTVHVIPLHSACGEPFRYMNERRLLLLLCASEGYPSWCSEKWASPHACGDGVMENAMLISLQQLMLSEMVVVLYECISKSSMAHAVHGMCEETRGKCAMSVARTSMMVSVGGGMRCIFTMASSWMVSWYLSLSRVCV